MKLSWVHLFLIVIGCLLIGAGASWYGYRHYSAAPAPVTADLFSDRFFDRFYDDDFFSRSRDPFQEMDRFRDRMQKELDQFDSITSGITSGRFDSKFDQWFSDNFGNSPASKIRMTEDDEHVYYTLDIGDADSEKVTVNVEGDEVEITAELKSREEQSQSDRLISSSRMETIQQRFPVPPGTDPASIKVEQPKGRVVVQFTKLTKM